MGAMWNRRPELTGSNPAGPEPLDQTARTFIHVTQNPPSGINTLAKLLSHRVRGFGKFENARHAFVAACASEVPFLEVDTRVSSDGVVFVYHDPSVHLPGVRGLPFATTPASSLQAVHYPDGDVLLLLESALESFTKLASPPKKLCIDIKDFGFEANHLELVRDAGLETRVCFVSWIPQTILRMRELGTSAPLILSYCSVLDFGVLGNVVDRCIAGHRLRTRGFITLGSKTTAEPLGNLSHGFEHALWCRNLPQPLLAALQESRGGVCVSRSFIGPRLARYCTEAKIQLWVYSVRTTADFNRYAMQPDIDVVFCDDAPRVWREVTNKQL